MYLSDRDLEHAVTKGHLIVNPPPREYDTSGIDVHLDHVREARVWSANRFEQDQRRSGQDRPFVGLGSLDYEPFASEYSVALPASFEEAGGAKVYRDGDRVMLEPNGFFLWQTKEEIGTPEIDPRYICFIDGKSTRARTGLLIHLTAPTIHAGWWGKVTLEIANLGPFRLALREGDAVAQIVVALITSPPVQKKIIRGTKVGQQRVTGSDKPAAGGKRKRSRKKE